MSEAGSVRRRRGRVEVEKLVAEYEASGLTRDGFCQQRGLSVAALDKYRQRVQKWARSGAGPMLPVEVVLSAAQGSKQNSYRLHIRLLLGKRKRRRSAFAARHQVQHSSPKHQICSPP